MRPVGGGGPAGGGMGGGGGMRGGGGGGFFEGGGGRHKYNLTLSVNINNLLNHTNFQNFSGVLSSPFFGLANRTSEARRITASMRFSF
jgi:hypothetical protein